MLANYLKKLKTSFEAFNPTHISPVGEGLKKSQSIIDWLEAFNIKNYIINEDLTVSVNGSVNLSNKKIKQLPIQFREVTDEFIIAHNPLTTLKGSPLKTNLFDCSFCGLTDLTYSPLEIGEKGLFACNNNLSVLTGLSQKIFSKINLNNNQLTNLKGLSANNLELLNVSNNHLISLEGSPKIIEYFDCSNNELKSLEFGPQKVRNYDCSNNYLLSLKFSPLKCSNLYCHVNELTSLEYCPKVIKETLKCCKNKINTLEFSPEMIGLDFKCTENQLTHLKTQLKSIGGNFSLFGNQIVSFKDCEAQIQGIFEITQNPVAKISFEDLQSLKIKGSIKHLVFYSDTEETNQIEILKQFYKRTATAYELNLSAERFNEFMTKMTPIYEKDKLENILNDMDELENKKVKI
jgi:DNA-binding Xre family transcriptional regulator